MDGNFIALEKQMQLLGGLTDKYAGAASAVRWTATKVRAGHATFSPTIKKQMEDELAEAHTNVRQMCDKGLLQAEIEYAQRLLAAAEVYEEKKKETRAQVTPKIADVPDEFVLLHEYTLQRESGGGLYPVHFTVRKYKLPNPHGEYQIWCDDEREETVSEDYVKQHYPEIPVGKMSQVVAGASPTYTTPSTFQYDNRAPLPLLLHQLHALQTFHGDYNNPQAALS
jgi:hypothetical protein